MNIFKKEDYNTFWGQYADIEQPIQKNSEPIKINAKTETKSKVTQKNLEPETKSDAKSDAKNIKIRSCNSMHFWLCLIVLIYLFI